MAPSGNTSVEHLGEFKITEKKRLKRSNLYDVNGDPFQTRGWPPNRAR